MTDVSEPEEIEEFEDTEKEFEEAVEEEVEAVEEVQLSEEDATVLQYMPKGLRELVNNLDIETQRELIAHHRESEGALRKKMIGVSEDVKLAENQESLGPCKELHSGESGPVYLSID